MDKFKNIINNFKNMFKDKQNRKMSLTFIGIMLGLILLIVIIANIMNHKVTYTSLENKLENAAYNYLQDHLEKAPTSSIPKVVIDTNDLVAGKYIKKLSKYIKDPSCTSNVVVEYNGGELKYQAYLTCKDFKTSKFVDILKNNNEKNVFGDGLYEINNEFIYRGQDPDNYLKFAGNLYRIIKIDENNKIYIILDDLDIEEADDLYDVFDDRYNSETESERGINNYTLSRALNNLNNIYINKFKDYNKYLTKFDLCIGKRNEESLSNDGSLECKEKMEEQSIGLLPMYDYMRASLDSSCITPTNDECQNYNYLADLEEKWWTLTGDSDNTYSVYYIRYSGAPENDYAIEKAYYRYVLALDKDILYSSGEGTEESPYEIR